MSRHRIAAWLAPAVPAERLAAVRILVGAFATVYLLGRMPYLLGHAHFDLHQFQPVGVVGLLDAPLPDGLVYTLTLATAVGGAAFTLGWRYRWTGVAFAALLLWTLSYRNSWGMIFHTENLLVLHVGVLALGPAADAWSLDARGRNPAGSDSSYGWPLRGMAIILVATYFLAGVAKLRWGGSVWLDGEVLRNLVATDTVRKMLLGSFYSPFAGAMVEWQGTFRALAIGTIIVELGAPLALVNRRATIAWSVAVLGFHWSVLAIMMIIFPYPMLGVAMACLFPVERWWRGLAAAVARRKKDVKT